MVMTVDEVFRELQKVSRQRALVKASHLSEAMKSKLIAQLDGQVRELEAKVFDPSLPNGGGTPPKGR